jgi:hypothetical protein
MIAAHREPDRTQGRRPMLQLIESLSTDVPKTLTELTTLGRTPAKRADDVLAYIDRPGTSNGPTEAINGRLEHTYAAPPLASATSPTTQPAACSRPADSGPDYTLESEEPDKGSRIRRCSGH